jgi:hypothetical protein
MCSLIYKVKFYININSVCNSKDTATILIITLLLISILIALNMGDITYNDVTYNDL